MIRISQQIIIIDQNGLIHSGKHKGKLISELIDTLFLFIIMTQAGEAESLKAAQRLEQLSIYQ